MAIRLTKSQMLQIYMDFSGKGMTLPEFSKWANRMYAVVQTGESEVFWQGVLARGHRIYNTTRSRDTSRSIFTLDGGLQLNGMPPANRTAYIANRQRMLLEECSA